MMRVVTELSTILNIFSPAMTSYKSKNFDALVFIVSAELDLTVLFVVLEIKRTAIKKFFINLIKFCIQNIARCRYDF